MRFEHDIQAVMKRIEVIDALQHDIQAVMKRIEVIDATMRYCPSKPKTCELCRNLRAERDRQEAYLSDLRADQREQHAAMIEAMTTTEGNQHG